MSLKKDKQKVLNEDIDDVRLQEFLDLEAPAGVTRDYHILERAYRGLQAPDFTRFVAIFCDAGLDINAQGPNGNLLSIIRCHNKGADYTAALEQAGAKA